MLVKYLLSRTHWVALLGLFGDLCYVDLVSFVLIGVSRVRSVMNWSPQGEWMLLKNVVFEKASGRMQNPFCKCIDSHKQIWQSSNKGWKFQAKLQQQPCLWALSLYNTWQPKSYQWHANTMADSISPYGVGIVLTSLHFIMKIWSSDMCKFRILSGLK